jgi:general secretion pathway protein I
LHNKKISPGIGGAKTAGFTLIEVLIAIAVLAIALLAVVRSTNVAIRNSEYIQQKVYAHWVTMDTLSSAQVGLTPIPAIGGTQSGQSEVFGKIYPWELTAKQAPDYPIIELTVHVFNAERKHSIDSAFVFLAKPGAK